MPYILTEQEKEAIRQSYLDNYKTINSYLQDGYKLKVDLGALNKKLNDPRQAWLYKKSLEVQAREKKKKEIQDRLFKKFAHLKIEGKAYELNRNLHTDLIASDDPEAEAYNEQIVKMYFQHPEAMTQLRFQNVLKANFSEVGKIAKSKDVESLMLLYAEKEPTLVEDSCGMVAALTRAQNYALLTPEMKEFLNASCGNFENIIDASNAMKKINTSFFTLPHALTENQDMLINGTSFMTDNRPLYDALNANLAHGLGGDMLVKQFKDFFAALPKYGVNIDEPGALTGTVLYPNNNGEKPVSLSAWICNGNTGNPTAVKLPADTVNNIKKIFVNDFTKEPGFEMPKFPDKFKEPAYLATRNEIIYQYALKYDKPVYEFDNGGFSKIAENIKGGVGERFFSTTSLEYTHLIQTMKDYDNPNHVGHNKPGPVKKAANEYLIHKGVTSREQAMRLSNPAKDRALLCFDLIESFQKHEGPEIPKIVPGTNQTIVMPHNVERVQAIIDPQEVEDDPMHLDEEDEEVDLNKSADLAYEGKEKGLSLDE